ncbi:hypothetical protein FACS1894124_8810 [Spirochaetia bacterium]|nr:hypothetical protein FACS1894124_8810 [Spirochaetia bacterium]
MNEFFKKVIGQITALWGKWSLVQRAILIGIVVVAVGGPHRPGVGFFIAHYGSGN